MTTQTQPTDTDMQWASFEKLHNRLTVTGTLVAQTAMRVGAGRASDIVGNDLPVLRDALKRPFIPGASLKGAFRARLESLIATIAPNQALTFEAMEQRTRNEVKEWKDEAQDDYKYSCRVWKASTMIDLTFGSPELASRIFFKDAQVDTSLWFNQYEVRNWVVIDRDTETAADKGLYDYEVVPAETRFFFELVMENAADWQLGMVMLALEPWKRGDAQIGGFRSRGLGYIKLEDVTCSYDEINKVQAIIDLLQGSKQQVCDNDKQKWIDAFQEELTKRSNKETSHA
jgi:CRISPR-associated RAMP protein (TIGR02581 family)